MKQINWYEMRVFFPIAVEDKDGLPIVKWNIVAVFDVTSKRKRRFYHLSEEQNEVLIDMEKMILGYHGESTAILYRFYGKDDKHQSYLSTKKTANLIEVMAKQLLQYGRESILLEYGIRDGHSEALDSVFIEKANTFC